ncbi:variant erythrocyte surface antigen beta subunit, putative [Babesia ovis]|uniref:Variant erythrocyte surface antigen beta subunit, putative n=1 Tax=Babesia ovis TaxID=5869 RepID=A0A9W5TCV0_BABOV|nr:variant erythrocyte surface antigen beta subunit, putative [Babesia ovis]
MASSGAGVTAAGGNRLTQSPTNLKEAIDWILRVTNKDGQQSGKDAEEYCWCDLANGVTDLLEGVEHHLTEEEKKVVKNIIEVLYTVGGTKHVKALIEKVASQLAEFIGWEGKYDTSANGGKMKSGGIGCCGKGNGNGDPCKCGKDGKSVCKGKKYESYYNGSVKFGDEMAGDDSDDKVREAKLRCAKILLGCIPLVFSGLSYLYWLLGVERNAFKEKLNGKFQTKRALVDEYMRRMGYSTDGIREIQVVNGNGESNTLKEVFKGCLLFGGVEVKNGENYAQYLEKLRKNAQQETTASGATTTEPPKHSLIILNTLCSGYFRSLHTIDSIRSPAPRTPRTIREILTLVPKVQEMFRKVGSGGKVVFYGNGSPLSVDSSNCASYLLGAALIAPMVLLSIQDTIESRVGHQKRNSRIGSYKLQGYTTRVPIHDLYANMQFWFSYPLSETQSYYLLQDCLVALFYQLYFLKYVTFSGYTQGYGWGYCKYGDGVKCDNISGWKCSLGGKKEHKNGSSGSDNQCGNGSGKNKSPLQAFLCDCLPGFTCREVEKKMEKYCKEQCDIAQPGVYQKCYMEFLEHRGHTTVPGTECAVPMGFSGSFRKDGPASGSQCVGLGLQAVLYYYADWDIYFASLYQITRCICSLTRRVPRSTGTLYGFFYGLGGVYSGKRGGFDKKLDEELNCCPGWRNPKGLMGALMEWTESDHSKKHPKGDTKPGNPTLGSLYRCNNANSSASCGSYLEPLTGSLYHSLATQFCETYVSWIVHLTKTLQSGLESLLEEFVKIDCEKSGCTAKSGSGHCCQGGDNHGTQCKCTSVVDCVGVHGLLYRFGFTYRDPGMLSKSGSSRKCDKFHQQLEKVLTESPFNKLLTQLRKFIYTTRALFGVYIGVYWSIVLLYLVYSMTVNLDILHIQSHWRSPGSYLLPVQRLLANGSRKGFCSVGYFQESGDRLLSQGVSDVYL